MVTVNQIRDLVISEVGDTADSLVASNWDAIWASYADYALVWPRLQELYSKKRACDLLLGRVRGDINFTIAAALHGTTEISLSQRTTNIRSIRKDTEKQIGIEEAKARAVRPGVVTQITRTEMELSPVIEPPPAIPDANSPLYRGDPYMSPGEGTGTVGPI